ncbi:hypothetical protein N0V84_008226 [Fusarium piperis]|uniref:Uncharacterized protein n=1 Tax=Fusarium piperis TaxID=1435070 RepID=A0A9W8W8M1_9HYPO|nr:hypothetical protein N0V84_008226 [Fusarium piperis]
MPPKTRSGGTPAPSRAYHSTPTQQQTHFPARRKVVRTYGKQNRKKQAETSAKMLRQQTLTQIEFVSSYEEQDPIVLSDSEDDEKDHDGDEEKEAPDVDQEEPMNDDDEEPVSTGRKRQGASKKASAKKQRTERRRTMDDNDDDNSDDEEPQATKTKTKTKAKRSSRRKTTGDVPSSSYHTQTLTQFIGRDGQAQYIKDSEDEEDEGFQQWLGDPTSPSPRRVQRLKSVTPLKRKRPGSASKAWQQPEEPIATREDSIVPQTPRKRAKSAEIPSSSQLSAPPSISSMASLMMDRYGAADQVDVTPVKGKGSSPAITSPLKEFTGKPRVATTPRRHERIIQDSYATESWGSLARTPLRELPVDSPNKTPRGVIEPLESSSVLSEMETPTKPRRRGESTELGGSQRRDRDRDGSPTPRMKMKLVSPGQGKKRVLLEIPDSEDEDDEDFVENDENDENFGGGDENDQNTFVAGPETQFVMNEIASSEERLSKTPTPADPTGSGIQRKILGEVSTGESSSSRLEASTSSPPLPPLSSRPTTLPALSPTPKPSRRPAKRLRKPIHRPVPPTQTQPLESQRVPLPTLQALPPASARTDVLLPLPQDMLDDVIEGFQVALVLPFKIPAQVVRFWLYDGELLRFLACAEPGRVTEGPAWRYHLTQIYELNNPVEGDDMREEGWLEGNIGRYIYIPPAVVGQLLWNLRHAIFDENDNGDAATQSQMPAEDDEETGRVNLFANSSQAHARDKNPAPTPSMSVSQQVEAQLKSDIAHSTQFPTSDDILVPSTPEEEIDSNKQDATPPTTHVPSSPATIKPPPPRTPFAASSYRASRPPLSSTVKPSTVRSSQATTVSQASTPEKNSTASIHRPDLHSSSSIGFPEGLLDDDGPSSPPLRPPSGYAAGSSQLLTKSQMLPDSLVRDDARVPPEIWDSDEDDERL